MDSLCTYVVNEGRVIFLADIPVIPPQLMHIKAYLGVPLTGREGLVIGALCILDTVVRDFGADDVESLQEVAKVVQDQLDLMRRLGAASHGSVREAAELAAAVENSQIEPFYQPIVDLDSGDIHAVEALARWQHPERGLLGAEAFIPVAEDSDIILDLDLSVLGQAAVRLGRWRIRHPHLRLNVNLSARHFHHPDCVRRLRDVVERAGCDPATVTLEVTETAAMMVGPEQYDNLDALRRLGFQIVLDDFGSGFASMEQVLWLPVDGIKLNCTLTAAMESNGGKAVVRHLVALANDLHLSTVLEGIERIGQAERAHRTGALFGQGHLWSPAIPAADMTGYLDRRRPGVRDADAVSHEPSAVGY